MVYKKIFSVILFIIGIFSVLAGWLFMFVTLINERGITFNHLSTLGISIMIGIIAIILGIKLMNFKEWKKNFAGVIFTIGGLFLIDLIISLFYVDISKLISLSFGIVSIFCLLIGVLLINSHKKNST